MLQSVYSTEGMIDTLPTHPPNRLKNRDTMLRYIRYKGQCWACNTTLSQIFIKK